MVPNWRDVQEFIGTMRWFLGLGPRPRYGKWTYWEKFDYFAVFWGVVVIGFSGLVLWFPVAATRVLPGWAINVATIIHSEEALLATGFIFSIHFFNTNLRPEKFPMDRVVFTGRMTVEELKADKPRLYDELVQKGELERHLAAPASPTARRAALVFGSIALAIGIVTIVLIVHGLLTVGS
jgi:cytochrome b subunit of formate dehydrogenase